MYCVPLLLTSGRCSLRDAPRRCKKRNISLYCTHLVCSGLFDQCKHVSVCTRSVLSHTLRFGRPFLVKALLPLRPEVTALCLLLLRWCIHVSLIAGLVFAGQLSACLVRMPLGIRQTIGTLVRHRTAQALVHLARWRWHRPSRLRYVAAASLSRGQNGARLAASRLLFELTPRVPPQGVYVLSLVILVNDQREHPSSSPPLMFLSQSVCLSVPPSRSVNLSVGGSVPVCQLM